MMRSTHLQSPFTVKHSNIPRNYQLYLAQLGGIQTSNLDSAFGEAGLLMADVTAVGMTKKTEGAGAKQLAAMLGPHTETIKNHPQTKPYCNKLRTTLNNKFRQHKALARKENATVAALEQSCLDFQESDPTGELYRLIKPLVQMAVNSDDKRDKFGDSFKYNEVMGHLKGVITCAVAAAKAHDDMESNEAQVFGVRERAQLLVRKATNDPEADVYDGFDVEADHSEPAPEAEVQPEAAPEEELDWSLAGITIKSAGGVGGGETTTPRSDQSEDLSQELAALDQM
jgi:hypothetical protein